MRMIQRIATIFSFVNLFFGVANLIGPLVRGNRDRYINTRPGYLFGLFATDWTHAVAHLVLAIAGFIPAIRNRFSRTYVAVLGGIYALFALMGWRKTGNDPEMDRAMGMPVNSYDNILHTVLASLAGVFAIFPDMDMRRMPSPREIGRRVRHASEDVIEQIDEKTRERMPV